MSGNDNNEYWQQLYIYLIHLFNARDTNALVLWLLNSGENYIFLFTR